MTLVSALSAAISRKDVIVRLDVRQHLHYWTELSSDVWYTTINYTLTGVDEDSEAMTEEASLAALIASDTMVVGGYFQTGTTLYIKPKIETSGGTGDPYTFNYVANIRFSFSEAGGLLDGAISCTPRLVGLPSLNTKINPRFDSAFPSFSAGVINLLNTDSYFNGLEAAGVEWDGLATILLGAYVPAPTPTTTSPEVIGVWRINQVTYTPREFTLSLIDRRRILNTKVGAKKFQQGTEDAANFTYPNLSVSAIGESVPVIFGPVKSVPAFLIDTKTKTFKVAGHAITSIGQCYLENGAAITPDTTTEASGEFTYAAYVLDEEDGGTGAGDGTIYCDVIAPTDNAVDVIETLLTSTTRGIGLSPSELLLGSSANYLEGFGADGAREGRIYGTKNGVEVALFAIGLYINEESDVFDLISKVAQTAFLYTYLTPAGLYSIRPWGARVGDAVDMTFQEYEIFDIPTVQAEFTDPLTSVTVIYQKNYRTDTSQTYTTTSSVAKELRGLAVHAEDVFTLPLTTRQDAILWAQRILAIYKYPVRTYLALVSAKALLLLPGDQIRLVHSEINLDEIFEVMEVSSVPGTVNVEIVLSDMHGYRNRTGFWVDATPTFPASLGGGSAGTWNTNWTDAQKLWAKERVGYWGRTTKMLNDPPDPDSHQSSVWA